MNIRKFHAKIKAMVKKNKWETHEPLDQTDYELKLPNSEKVIIKPWIEKSGIKYKEQRIFVDLLTQLDHIIKSLDEFKSNHLAFFKISCEDRREQTHCFLKELQSVIKEAKSSLFTLLKRNKHLAYYEKFSTTGSSATPGITTTVYCSDMENATFEAMYRVGSLTLPKNFSFLLKVDEDQIALGKLTISKEKEAKCSESQLVAYR